MKEHVSQQPPPLSRQCEWPEVGAKTHHHLPRKIHHGTAGERHRKKDRYIGAEQYVSESDAGLAPDPGRSHDGLLHILAQFAALRGLVLHTPLTNLLAKHQRRKLPATSNAVRHVLQKSISSSQGFGRAREVCAGLNGQGFGKGATSAVPWKSGASAPRKGNRINAGFGP